MVPSVSVCLLAYLKNDMAKFHQIFCTYYTWPWLGPLYYVFPVRFVDDVMFVHTNYISLSVCNTSAVLSRYRCSYSLLASMQHIDGEL